MTIFQIPFLFLAFPLSFLACVALVATNDYKDCGSPGSKLVSVGVIPCDHDDDDICILRSGKIYAVTVKLIPNVNSTSATNRVSVIARESTILFPESNACEWIKCPIVAGIEQEVTGIITGDASYPKPKIDFKWEVLADNHRTFFCLVIPFKTCVCKINNVIWSGFG